MTRCLLALLPFCLIYEPVLANDPAQAVVNYPRIESIALDVPQPHAADPAVIWYDDFDDPLRQTQYPEQNGGLTSQVHFGATGSALEMFYPRGERGRGGRKIFFGDCPTYRRHVVRGDEFFDDVYWRIYLRQPSNWQGGGPAKLSRATSLVPPGWRQAMIAHVWSSGEALTLDPASGVRDGQVVTEGYNDFPNLKWLGNRPASDFKLHGHDGLGWWVCVEARAKLNTPGKQDGLTQLWIDGRLEAERRNLDWRGTYDGVGINAVFIEAYWNQGSPVDQSRWIDNFVVSTAPIGPVVCSTNPVLFKAAQTEKEQQGLWQVELGTGNQAEIVWRSKERDTPRQVRVDRAHGEFVDRLQESGRLDYDTVYFCRVRQQDSQGNWTAWSPWHQRFRTTRGPIDSH